MKFILNFIRSLFIKSEIDYTENKEEKVGNYMGYSKVVINGVIAHVFDTKGLNECEVRLSSSSTVAKLSSLRYDDINKEKFEGFEKRDILTTSNDATDKIDSKNDYIAIKFLKLPKLNQESTEDYNDYRISTLRIVKSNLPTNVAISKIKLEVTAETTNFTQSDTKHFSKYVKLFVYEGALVADIPNSRTVSLAEEYKVEKIYFDIEVELENGKVENFKYYVLTSELLEG